MKNKKLNALIIVGPRFQDHEFIYPFYRLQEAGFKVDIATTDKQIMYGDLGGEKIKAVPTISTKQLEKKGTQFDLILLPGGAKSLEKIRQDKYAIAFIKKHFLKGKTVSALCHGTQLLIEADVLRGRRASAYYSIARDVENAGAKYVKAPVVIDKNLITSPHYDFMGDFMRETIKACLKT